MKPKTVKFPRTQPENGDFPRMIPYTVEPPRTHPENGVFPFYTVESLRTQPEVAVSLGGSL